MNPYASLLRPLLFALDPETAHAAACAALRAAERLPLGLRAIARAFLHEDPRLETTVAGLRFPNPVGLAAGFDKDCLMAGALPALGFGFIEVGTVTLRPQPGNPRPRLFRVPEARALINRMGFNNEGADAAAGRLRALARRSVPIGVNLGINKDARAEEAPRLYAEAFEKLSELGDYFVVNVSSPNTRGLRRLQDRLRLERILLTISERNAAGKPVFVKLAPDLEPEALEDLLPMLEKNASGVIAANTTNSPELRAEVLEDAARERLGAAARPGAITVPFPEGGLSGAPLRDPSTAMIRRIRAATGGRLPIIGVGGIFDAADAYQKIRAGASLVQIYTGLIYEGPGLPGLINRGLSAILDRQGLPSIAAAIGASDPEPQESSL